MELPKNVTQIGEPDPRCKIYVEDYVISYIKQLNRPARDKAMAVALYGTRQEEAGVTYLFFYGACRLNFLQRESRHLPQAVQQEVEEQRRKYFSQYTFLGYKLLNGEMVEGFQICEQGVCRYIEGYAQFYEKNDIMLAYMLEDRKEAVKPEVVDQEKYEEVKKRQEERRIQSEEQSTPALLRHRQKKTQDRPQEDKKRLQNMRYAAAAVFVLLFVAGFATLNNGAGLAELQKAAGQILEAMNTQQLPDAEVNESSHNAGTLVAEPPLVQVVEEENQAANVQAAGSGNVNNPTPEPTPDPTPEPTPDVTPEPTPDPTPEPPQEPTPEPVSQPVSYTIQRGDTLIEICMRQYGSDARVAEICELNGIIDADDIKAGQKILLP